MKKIQQDQIKCSVFILMSLLIGIIYSNTLDASWHLDDYPNIVHNPAVHLISLDFKSLQTSLYGAPTSSSLYRPIGYLSFALNWFFGGEGVFGFHLVNTIIHMLCAIFLFLLIRRLFSTPTLKIYGNDDAFFIALLASSLWAIHPIQTQAVTYIVQRLASLSALFYIVSFWSYVSGRLNKDFTNKLLWYACCLIFYILAIWTKENTVLLPIVLILADFIFFQDLNDPETKRRFYGFIGAGTVAVFIIVVFFFLGGDIGSLVRKYQVRPFSFNERFLTEFRIVIYYLLQLMYPAPNRFSITHDFSISTSLFSPWTTLHSLLIIISMLVFALWQIKKFPVISFAITFFFINHLIESTFLPLELVFEHRNYLPSMFLFFPLSIGIKKAFDYYQIKNKQMFYFLVLSVSLLVTGIGFGAYIRNMDWQSEKSLWLDAMEKAPESARPHHNLAWGYYTPTGQIEKAVFHYHRALNLVDDSVGFQATTYFNLANIFYSHFQNYEKAIDYAQKTVDILPGHDRAKLLQARSLIQMGRHAKALQKIDFVTKEFRSESALHLKGLLLLHQSHPDKALEFFRKCLTISPENWNYLKDIGFSLAMMNHQNQAFWFLRRANALNPNQPDVLLALAENSLQRGDKRRAKVYIASMVQVVGIDNMESFINSLTKNQLMPSISYSQVMPLIFWHLICKSDYYKETASRLISCFK